MENKEIELEFSIKSGAPEKQRTACVVVGVFENRKLSGPAIDIDRASDGYLSEATIYRLPADGTAVPEIIIHNGYLLDVIPQW